MTRLRSKHHSSAAGFTLVELLTVVAIISILAAITIVTVGNVRDKARATQCTGNLRELHRAFILYVADNKGRFPYDMSSKTPENTDETSQHWHRRIYPYLSSIPNLSVWPRGAEKIYLCPAGEDSSYAGVISYGINTRLVDKTQLQVTTNPILLGDCNNWRLTGAVNQALQYRHNKQAQVVRLDGSIMSSPDFPTVAEEPRLWKTE